MSKAQQATGALKAAVKALSELTVVVDIHARKSQLQVHVLGLRALEQIPGKTGRRTIGHGSGAAIELSRVFDDVKFYCLLTPGQYEKLKEEGLLSGIEKGNLH